MCIYFKFGPLVQGRYHFKIFLFLALREKTTWVDPENSVRFFFSIDVFYRAGFQFGVGLRT